MAYALTQLQKRALAALLLVAVLVEYVPSLPFVSHLLYGTGSTNELQTGAAVPSNSPSYNVAAFQLPHQAHSIEAKPAFMQHEHIVAAAETPVMPAAPPPSRSPSLAAAGRGSSHAHASGATCPRTAPLPSSVLELMKASNRTVHMLNQHTKKELEETQRQLAATAAQLAAAEEEVSRLQHQLRDRQVVTSEQRQQYSEKLEGLKEMEARLEEKQRELEQQEAALQEAQSAVEVQRSAQVEVEVQLAVRQQELDEKAAALTQRVRQHAQEMAALEDRHASELAERHVRLSQCAISLGRATASLEEAERKTALQDKRLQELETQVQEARRAEKARGDEAGDKIRSLQQQLRKQEEAAALELAAAQQLLGAEQKAHQHTAEQLVALQQRERRQALEAAAEMHRLQKSLADKDEAVARQRQQLQELADENTKLSCKLDSTEAAVTTLEHHLMSLNEAMEAST